MTSLWHHRGYCETVTDKPGLLKSAPLNLDQRGFFDWHRWEPIVSFRGGFRAGFRGGFRGGPVDNLLTHCDIKPKESCSILIPIFLHLESVKLKLKKCVWVKNCVSFFNTYSYESQTFVQTPPPPDSFSRLSGLLTPNFPVSLTLKPSGHFLNLSRPPSPDVTWRLLRSRLRLNRPLIISQLSHNDDELFRR